MALTDKLSAIAESIRSKTGSTDKMTLDEMATNIANIKSGDISAFINSDNLEIGLNDSEGYFGLKCIKKLPENLDTSNVNNLAYAFAFMESLTEIPNIDVSNCMRFNYMFYNCKSLKKIPKLNFNSNLISLGHTSNMFYGCKSLTTEDINAINLPPLRTVSNLFGYCTSMKEIPNIDISNLDYNSSGSSSGFFTGSGLVVADCSNLILPKYSSNKDYYAQAWFNYCNDLVEIKNWDTSFVVKAGYMFQQIPKLKKLCALDFSNVNSTNPFPYSGIPSLEDFGGFINLGKAYTGTYSNVNNYKLDLSKEINLTHESLMNVINGLYDIASAGVATQQLILGSTNLAKLTEDEIVIATTKGWSVS